MIVAYVILALSLCLAVTVLVLALRYKGMGIDLNSHAPQAKAVKGMAAMVIAGVLLSFVLMFVLDTGRPKGSTTATSKKTESTYTPPPRTYTPPSTTTTQNQVPPTPPEPAPQNFSGTGDTAIPAFNLKSGLAFFEMSHKGGGNFAIQLYSNTGEYIDLLVNTIGSFTGTKVISIDLTGSFVLNVTASGSWSVKVTQPNPVSIGYPPISFSQGIRFATPFFSLRSGVATFKMAHNGSQNFAVILYDSYGNYIDLLANEIGPYSGSQTVPVRQGTYILDVEANGNWTIDITQ